MRLPDQPDTTNAPNPKPYGDVCGRLAPSLGLGGRMAVMRLGQSFSGLFARLCVPVALLSLTACVDTHISLDLREPDQADIRIEALLKPPALEVLTLRHPELRHGDLSEPTKQERICKAFFSDDPRAVEVLGKPDPIEKEGITLKRLMGQNGNGLVCGFEAIGPVDKLQASINRSQMISLQQEGERLIVRLNTSKSDYGDLPTLGLFDALKRGEDDTPRVFLEVRGHELRSNFEAGIQNSTRFDVSENLIGRRQHFQSEFQISVNAGKPSLLNRLEDGLNSLMDWVNAQMDQTSPPAVQ